MMEKHKSIPNNQQLVLFHFAITQNKTSLQTISNQFIKLRTSTVAVWSRPQELRSRTIVCRLTCCFTVTRRQSRYFILHKNTKHLRRYRHKSLTPVTWKACTWRFFACLYASSHMQREVAPCCTNRIEHSFCTFYPCRPNMHPDSCR